MDNDKFKQKHNNPIGLTQYWMHFCALPVMEMVLLASDFAYVTQPVQKERVVRTTLKRRTSRQRMPSIRKHRMVRTASRMIER